MDQEPLAADLQHLRHLLEAGRVTEARRFVNSWRRWPAAERGSTRARGPHPGSAKAPDDRAGAHCDVPEMCLQPGSTPDESACWPVGAASSSSCRPSASSSPATALKQRERPEP